MMAPNNKGASGAGGGAGGGQRTGPHRSACRFCRKQKRKCFPTGVYPCNCCVKGHRKCIPPQEGQAVEAAAAAAAAAAGWQEQQQLGHNVPAVGAATGGLQQELAHEQEDKSDDDDKEGAWAEQEEPATALVLYARQADRAAIISVASAVGRELVEAGLPPLHRERLVEQLKKWGSFSGALRLDLTQDLFNCVRKKLGMRTDELYVAAPDEANLNLGSVPGESYADREERVRNLHVRRLKLLSENFPKTKTFKEKNHPAVPLCMCLYSKRGESVIAVNEAFEAAFMSAKSMIALVKECAVLPELLPLLFMEDNEDRRFYLKALLGTQFNPSLARQPHRSLKMLGRDGVVALHNIRMEPVSVPDGKRGVAIYFEQAHPIHPFVPNAYVPPRAAAVVSMMQQDAAVNTDYVNMAPPAASAAAAAAVPPVMVGAPQAPVSASMATWVGNGCAQASGMPAIAPGGGWNDGAASASAAGREGKRRKIRLPAPGPLSDAPYNNFYINNNHDEARGPTPATPAAAAPPLPELDEAAMLWAPCMTAMSPTIDRRRLGPTPDLDGAFLEALF